jgi:hypothetical protein
MTNTTNDPTPNPILYASPNSLKWAIPTISVTFKPTALNTIPYISAESTKPLHVAVLSMSDTLTKLLKMWTAYIESEHSTVSYEQLDAEFSTIRTAYLKAKAQAERT